MKRWWKWGLGVMVLLAVVYVLIGVDVQPHVEYVPEDVVAEVVDSVLPPPAAYGIPMSGFELEEGIVKAGATFGDLLAAHGVPMSTINALVELAGPHFDVRRMRAGHPFAFIFPSDSAHTPAYFVYESDQVEYVVFGMKDSLKVTVGLRPVKTTEHSIACIVTGALYNDFSKAGADPALAMHLADVFAWTVDFYRIQKNDIFSVVYREQTVDGDRYGAPEILAARYTTTGHAMEAFRFDQGDGMQYFDAEGNSLRKAFLKAPLKFSRISSGFSMRRFHPVQKVMKAHLGTDYAAPYGTPILTVGDGTVETTGRTAGNGNYVKIRHNGTYTTQYLHMRKILVAQGQRVQQGDVIGEVGSTGLATGPHVCFRFWKNGVQVDPRKEEIPSAEPLAKANRAVFDSLRAPFEEDLDEAELAATQARTVNF